MNRPSELAVLSGVSRTFAGAEPVTALRDVCLTINRGDYMSIVGPSGSGKSTLLNILGLLDGPTAGSYLLDGTDVSTLSSAQRSALRGSRIGFVFQAFHLSNFRTVLDNVALAGIYSGVPRKQRIDGAREALETVGLGHRLEFLPSSLSGGERQRVAIARALATEPHILLCDEPTGNLDSARALEIIALFEQLHERGFTVVIVTHDEQIATRTARCVRVIDGHVSESGQPSPTWGSLLQ